MSLQDRIRELTASDGPNIPISTLAIYCGTSHTTLIQFCKGKRKLSEELEKQVEKGLKEFGQLVWKIVNS